jgi:hypothetical protein
MTHLGSKLFYYSQATIVRGLGQRNAVAAARPDDGVRAGAAVADGVTEKALDQDVERVVHICFPILLCQRISLL